MHKAAIISVAAAAGLANAAAVNASFEQHNTLDMGDARTGQSTQELCIDLSGIESWDALGDNKNIVIEEFLGAGTSIVGVRWEDVQLSTIGESFLSEAAISLNGEVVVNVGADDNFSGTGNYTYDGIFDLMERNLQYTVGNNGKLSLEFFELDDDDRADVDATYESGKLFIYYIPVPAPGSTALLGLAGLAMTRRQRI